MNLSLSSALQMAMRTIRNPKEGAEELLALGISRDAAWTALFLVVVLSIIFAHLTNILIVLRGGMVPPGFLGNPLATGGIQFVLLILTANAIFFVSRAMGGSGNFIEGLVSVVWIQFIMVCVQAVQTASILILPALSSLIGLVGLGLFFWLLTNFIAAVHGFKSLAQVFVMILVTSFAIVFVASILMAVLGISIPVEATV